MMILPAYLWTEESPQTKDHLDRQLLSVNDQHLFLMSDLLYNIYSCVILYKTTCQICNICIHKERIVFVVDTFTNSASSRSRFPDILVTHSSATLVARTAFLETPHSGDPQKTTCFLAFVYSQNRRSSFALFHQKVGCAIKTSDKM